EGDGAARRPRAGRGGAPGAAPAPRRRPPPGGPGRAAPACSMPRVSRRHARRDALLGEERGGARAAGREPALVEPHDRERRPEPRLLGDLRQDVHELAKTARELREDGGARGVLALVLAAELAVGASAEARVVA